jgi:glycosyltransferase involved in cell wall biosynthesis
MGALDAVFVSFRLGDSDGVSVETRKWEWALHELGFATRRVAGELADGLRPDDTWLPYLAIDPPPGAKAEPDALAASLAGSHLVVVENLCSLPLNVEAAHSTMDVLDRHAGRVLFHHHDLPWERPHLAHLTEFPPHRPNSLHVTINDMARRELAERDITASTIRNAFDLHPYSGDRSGTRKAFGFAVDDLVVVQPTRAIPRKEVARGVAFAEQLATCVPDRSVRYWLTGPAEDGFGPELEQIVAAATVSVSEGRAPTPWDAYAASDVVAFPSSWEGFGNPVIEATIAERPVAVSHYPVLDELRALGLQVFDVGAPEEIAEWLDAPDTAMFDANRACLREHFNLADLPSKISSAFAAVGWADW